MPGPKPIDRGGVSRQLHALNKLRGEGGVRKIVHLTAKSVADLAVIKKDIEVATKKKVSDREIFARLLAERAEQIRVKNSDENPLD